MAEEVTKKSVEKNKTKRPWWKRVLRILGKTGLVLFLLFIAIVLFVRSKWGQDIIVGKITTYLSEKTETKVSIDNLYITFSGEIDLRGLYLEDKKGDTLLYSKSLQVNIPLWPIIVGNPISIDDLHWNGLRANVTRKDTVEGFNYQFLIDAFASEDTTTTKDKNTDPPKISIGSLTLSDFKINFDDAITGTTASLNMGNLYFEGKDFDLKKMKFQVSKVSLENTIAKYVQTKPAAPADTTESVKPYLSLDDLKIKNVILLYQSDPDGIAAGTKISDLGLQIPKVDLANQNIDVGDFYLKNSIIKAKIDSPKKSMDTSVTEITSPEEIAPFIWPNWNITVNTIALEKNEIHFQIGEKPTKTDGFNPEYIVLNNFNFKAKDIALSKRKSAKINLQNFYFQEMSGLKLKKLAFSALLKPTVFSLDDFIFQTGNSGVSADLKAKFSSIEDFLNKPEKAQLTVDLNQFIIDMYDGFAVLPELKANEYLEKLTKHKFTGHLKAKGTLASMSLSDFTLNWGQKTTLKTFGEFYNLTDSENLTASIENFTFTSTRSDIANFVSEEELGISIPERVDLKTQIHGKLDDFDARALLTIPEGKIKLNGHLKLQDQISFSTNIDVIELKLGKILNDPSIGTVAFKMDASGYGNSINDLNAQLTSQFSKLEFNGYNYSALLLDGKLNQGTGDVILKHNDENLALLINANIQLDSISPKVAVDFNMEGADLYALGFTEKEIRTKLMMHADFEGSTENFQLALNITEGVAVYDESTFNMGALALTASTTSDSTAMDIKSDFLNGKLRANAGIDSITSAIQQHLKRFFMDSLENITEVENPVELELNLKLSKSKLITDFFVPEIKTIDTLDLSVNFSQKENTLTANFNLPYIDYADKTIDSLQLRFNSTKDAAKFKFGFANLNAAPFLMHRTFFDGELNQGILNLNFNSFDGEKETYIVKTEISGNTSDLKIHFIPDELVFQGEQWTIPSDNQINILENEITAQNFILSLNEQSITISNDLKKTSQNNIGIGFKNFKLENLTSLLNKDDLLASGKFQGDIIAINPLGNFGLDADFQIENLSVLKAPLGNLALKSNSENGDNYSIDLGLKGDDIDLDLNGNYSVSNSSSPLDFKLDINKIGMKTIAIISNESLKDASGNISGELALKGDATSPKYNGYIQFNDAIVNVSELNAKFRLVNDKIKIDSKAITLNQFSIKDEQDNSLTLDGSILTESLSNPKFDLRINGKNFHALNSTNKDNELYYGDVFFDMDGTVKGDLSLPVVDMAISINENTDVTYVLLDSEAKIESRDGIVEFVNKENPNNILTKVKDSNDITTFGGIELHANVNIDKNANFNVIIDPQTGDNLNISGIGTLDLNIADNGQTTLKGRYEISKGHYSLSLYNLVKRKFEFVPGGSVTWRGDPMDAELNVSAKYAVQASASGLMASQTAGASEELSNKYRQKLPFFVYLNVNGELDQPTLGFRLDMPEDYRGAIDGTVYGRIKQVNSEEGELSKQVFSLLVLNKFYPNAGSDGSDGGAASLVRKNVNDALSDQLNAFSSKLTGNTGIELDFGLNSYTDYQGESAEQRTDLNISAQKKLLNDRLIIQVGSNVSVEGSASSGEENPLVGNVSIQYLLTEDGRWRIKGFRNSEYENVIDGQIFVNGISLLFQRQFNRFSELFVKPEEDNSAEDPILKKNSKNSDEKPENDEKVKN